MAISIVAKFDLDRWGALASGLCAVHCAIVGLAMGILPIIGMEFLAYPMVDVGFFGTAILLGSWAARTGFKKHRSWGPTKVFVSGLFLVMFSHFVLGHKHAGETGNLHSLLGFESPAWLAPIATMMAVVGGLTLVTFHILNHRLANRATCGCAVCHVEDHLPASAQQRTP